MLKLRIAITGSGGYLANQLIERLGTDHDCEYILGLDNRPHAPKVTCPAEFLRFDMTAPWEDLAELFRARSINAGLHLAWQFNPIHDKKRQRHVDVDGSRNFFRAAEGAGLKRVVYTSSTTAYTNPQSPSVPPFLNEDTPVSGTPRYLYSKHKAEVDRMAQEFLAKHAEIQVVLLRVAMVLGPNTQNIVSQMLEWPWRKFPWIICVRGGDPPMQIISEEDIAEILFRALKFEKSGIFNCAGDGIVRLGELVQAVGRKPLEFPASLIYPLTELLWILRLSPFPSGILDMIRYPWVADNTRLKTIFGYTPRFTSRKTLDLFLASFMRRPN